MSNLLISVEELAKIKSDDNVMIIDVSVQNVVGKEPIVYDSLVTIPNSYFFDLFGELEDKTSSKVHAFPTTEIVSKALSKLGITKQTHVVLYDNQGIYTSPRTWWVLNAFGVQNVQILDGGLPQWIEQGYPVDTKYLESTPTAEQYPLALDDSLVVSKEQVLANIESAEFNVIDVRKEGRFDGTLAEPREGMRGGHIPNSINMPFAQTLNKHTYKAPSELETLFKSLEFDESKPVVMSCGSGITACIGLIGAKLAGYESLAVYDGSWSEWGSDHSLPIAK